MSTAILTSRRGRASGRRAAGPRSSLSTLAWGALLLLGAFPLFAAVADLHSELHGGIPADHRSAFAGLAGSTVAAARSSAPGVMRYVHTLEVGYAVHELVFGGLFLAIVAIPLRRREPWAWWACWIVLAADLTYALTFGLHSATILRQSLIAVVGLPVLLSLLAPSVFRRRAT